MKGQPLSVHGTSLCAANFRIFFHMNTDNRTQVTVDHPSITWQLLSTGRDRASRAISRVH